MAKDVKKEIESAMKEIDLTDLLKSIGEIKEKKSILKNIKCKKSKLESEDLEELYAYGLMAGVAVGKPVFIFKNSDASLSFPVRVNELQASLLALSLEPRFAKGAFHGLYQWIQSMSVGLEQIVFTDIREGRVISEIEFSIDNELFSMELMAEDILPFALETKMKFFAKSSLADRARLLDLELFGSSKEWDSNFEKDKTGQKYLI